MAKTPSLLDLVGLLPARDITRAARALGLTPEVLIKKVGTLESVLGTKLVDTATKALRPGEAGRLVIDHASRIFSQARDFTRDLEELAGLQAPEINFGTDMFAAELPLGITLGRMASANSRLRVRTVIGDFEDLTRAVLGGKLEFAVADTTSAERHTARLAIEPIAEHQLFFFARHGHPLTTAKELTLESILETPLVSPRVPQRIAVHIAKSMPLAKVDRETGDLSPNLMLDSFAVAKAAVLAGDAIALAPIMAIEADLRARRIALIRYEAAWMHMSYGLFYPRKRSLSRAAQLFVTQLRQVETMIQEREQRALARMDIKRHSRKVATRRTTARAKRSSSTPARRR